MKKSLPTLMLLLAVTFASAQIDIFNGLQGHYTFNGDATDATANHYDGTLHGLAHVNGYRLILGDNLHDYMELPAAVMNGLGDFTIAFHVAFETFHVAGENPTNQVLSGYGPGIDGLGVAYTKSINSWVFTVNGESVEQYDPTVTEFSLLCFFLSREGDSLKLFIDAVQVGSWQINTDPISIDNLVVGQRATCPTGCFKQKQCAAGRVENLAFWNRALTQDEIDYGCHPPHTTFDYFNVNCTAGTVDFVNSSEHADFYSWNFGDGNSSTEMNPEHSYNGGAGTYTVTLVSFNQWNHLSDTLSQEVIVTNTTVDPDVSADGSTTICDGSSVLLNASPADAASYQWNLNGVPISGATNSSYTAMEGGDYSVSVTNATECSGVSGAISVSINESPLASIVPDGPVAICEGGTQMYMANMGDLTYQWTMNGDAIAGATSMMYMATSPGSYAVTTWNVAGCSATSSSSTLMVNASPAATISPSEDISFCEGTSQTYTANSGGDLSYQWTINGDPISGETNQTYSTNAAGTYAVIVTNSSNCSATSSSSTLTVNAKPVAVVTADGSTTFCEGGSVNLIGTDGLGYSYQWKKDGSNINGATDIKYTANSSGNYQVKITNANGCKATSNALSITVNANPEAAIDPSGEVAICEGGTQMYMANMGDLTYQWTMDGDAINGATSMMYMATSPGSYAVTTWSTAGCSATSSSSQLTVNANPEAAIDPSGDVAICEGGTQMYMANMGDLTYQWTMDGDAINGATSMMYMATSSGSYAVTTWNAAGCSATSSSSTLTVNANPVASIDPSGDVAICDGGTQMYMANMGDLTYQWTFNGDAINGATDMMYMTTSSGTYAVITWNEAGCSATSSSSQLSVNANPEATIDPSGDVAICDGGTQMYMANMGDLTYQWTLNGETIEGATDMMYMTTSSGTYAVITWNEAGCSATSSSSALTVNANPTASIDPSSDVAICEGGSQMYMANMGDLTYQWTLNGDPIEAATSMMYMTSSSGTYAVITWNAAGCSATSSSSTLTVNASPEATITASGDLSICQGKNVELSANTGLDLTYQWQMDGGDISGATADSYLADEAGSYSVLVTNLSDCSTLSDPLDVIVNPLPEISLGEDLTVCDTDNYVIDAGGGFASYHWNDGSENQSIPVSNSGDYWVIVTDAQGCGATDTVNVTVEICSGIDEVLLSNAINIYPNPTFGVFVVEINMPAVDQARIDLVNTLGQYVQPIYEGKVAGRMSIEVDGKNLSKGVYFVKMNIGDTIVTKKVVISSE